MKYQLHIIGLPYAIEYCSLTALLSAIKRLYFNEAYIKVYQIKNIKENQFTAILKEQYKIIK